MALRLIYQGKNGEFINEVPARDLEQKDVQEYADKMGYSLAQAEGLLIKNGLYKASVEAPKKTSKIESEGE